MLNKLPEIWRFAAVGSINFAIDIVIFSIAFYLLGMPILIANTLAYSLATINSYLMNKYWTFAGRSAREISTEEFGRFLMFNIGGLVLSNLTVYVLAEFMMPLIAKLIAVGVTFVWNYLTIRRFVFHNK